MRLLAMVALLGGCSPRVLGLPSRDALVAYLAQAKGEQHVCVIPYDHYAWVYWQEGRKLVLWEGSRERDALLQSRHAIELDRDVTEGAHGITRAWVDDTLRDCREYGMRYTIAAQ